MENGECRAAGQPGRASRKGAKPQRAGQDAWSMEHWECRIIPFCILHSALRPGRCPGAMPQRPGQMACRMEHWGSADVLHSGMLHSGILLPIAGLAQRRKAAKDRAEGREWSIGNVERMLHSAFCILHSAVVGFACFFERNRNFGNKVGMALRILGILHSAPFCIRTNPAWEPILLAAKIRKAAKVRTGKMGFTNRVMSDRGLGSGNRSSQHVETFLETALQSGCEIP